MSGGAYNYAFFAVPRDLQAAAQVLMGEGDEEGIVRRLWELAPGTRAALDAMAAAVMVQTALELSGGLEDVLRAVEWLDSGDFGEDQVLAAVAEYVKSTATP